MLDVTPNVAGNRELARRGSQRSHEAIRRLGQRDADVTTSGTADVEGLKSCRANARVADALDGRSSCAAAPPMQRAATRRVRSIDRERILSVLIAPRTGVEQAIEVSVVWPDRSGGERMIIDPSSTRRPTRCPYALKRERSETGINATEKSLRRPDSLSSRRREAAGGRDRAEPARVEEVTQVIAEQIVRSVTRRPTR